MLSTDNYSKQQIEENSRFGEYKFLLKLYEKINSEKAFGALIINKSNKNDKRYLVILSE